MQKKSDVVFDAAQEGDWPTVKTTFHQLAMRAPQYEGTAKKDERLRGTPWAAMLETEGCLEQFAEGDEKYIIAFGLSHDIKVARDGYEQIRKAAAQTE